MAHSLCLGRQSIALWKFIVEGKNRCEEPYKNTYSSTVEFSTKMTGDAEFPKGSGKWTTPLYDYTARRGRDPDLAAHFTVARKLGICLHGTAAPQILGRLSIS